MAQEAFTETELVRETEAPLFVINLCASTTPVALAHPDHPELKRFTFFVTRRREEGRERFRLHMGYFARLDEAEQLLDIVRDVYPAAWAGPAPGPKKPAPRSAAPLPGTTTTPPAVATPVAVQADAPVAAVTTWDIAGSLDTMSNVREVLAALADEAKPVAQLTARHAPQPMPPRTPPAQVPELTLEATGRQVASDLGQASGKPSLSDSQVLRVLEERRAAPAGAAPLSSDASAETSIRMLAPEDTQTLRDIKRDVQANAQVSFAVQLQWSVTPIDMSALPQLAIFAAYTLYTVEGNRQGRRWYGLRLGFFTDALSAKQVAYYVRSDFTSVAVVPVTAKERDRASGKGEPSSRAALDAGATGSFVAPAKLLAVVEAASPVAARPPPKPDARKDSGLAGFKLLDNDLPTVDKAAAKGRTPTGKRPAMRGRAARAQSGAPQTLEQTLEVLGASSLSIDKSSTVINDSAVRRLDVNKKKPSRFGRLLDRLAEKM